MRSCSVDFASFPQFFFFIGDSRSGSQISNRACQRHQPKRGLKSHLAIRFFPRRFPTPRDNMIMSQKRSDAIRSTLRWFSSPCDFSLCFLFAPSRQTLQPNWFFDTKLFSRVLEERISARVAQTQLKPQTRWRGDECVWESAWHYTRLYFHSLASRCLCKRVRRERQKKSKQVYDFAGALLSSRSERKMARTAFWREYLARAAFGLIIILIFSYARRRRRAQHFVSGFR